MSTADKELPLSSARDAVRFRVTRACAAIIRDGPAVVSNITSIWQPHGSLQRHSAEEHEHGHAPMDGSDGGAVNTPLVL
jgi:hypothetical protein